MEIRQLKHFLAVLEHGSMSRAAEALGISHQGLSKSIAGLEESLQVQLLVRGPRGVTASAFGQVLQEYARFIDGEHDNALHALAALRGGGAGHLTIATGISAATTIVPTAAGRLFARRPGTSLTVLTGPYAQFRAAVEEGEIALFIGTVLEEAASPVITIERLFVDRDYVVARPGHPLMQRASVSLAELSTFPWVFSVGTHEFRRDFLRRFPHELSGGMRQRVMIAMALANEPDLLIADEPTTAVDVTVQAQILDLLLRLQREHQMAMLFITHDLGVIRKIAENVCVMTKGEIVEKGETARVFSTPQHAYTRHLLAAEPKGEPPPADPGAPVVMQADALKVWFPIRRGFFRRTVGHVKAVDGISIAIRQGQTLGVVGESGSGKTTLGLAMLRLCSSEGRIVFLGREIQGRPWRETRPLRRHMQVVFQDPYGSLSPRMSVGDIVTEGLRVHERSLTGAERDNRAARALEEVGLDPATRHRYPHEFSGGQRQRIAVARAMVLQPRFVMLDEPTSALDMSVQAQVVDLLADLQRRHGLAYMFISHDLKVVRALANELIVLRHGRVVEQGPADSVFQNPQSDYTKALMAAAFRIESGPAGVVSQ